MTLPILCTPPGDDIASTLDAPFLHGSQTVIHIQTADVSRFGSPSASSPIRIRIVSQSQLTNGIWTISDPTAVATYRCTGVSGSTLTGITFESGTNQDFTEGDLVTVAITAKDFGDIHRHLRSGTINVLQFGTVVGDGVTDDGAALQAIIDANPGKTIFFPKTQNSDSPSYYSSITLTLASVGTRLVGESAGHSGGTIIHFAKHTTGIMIMPTAGNYGVDNIYVLGYRFMQLRVLFHHHLRVMYFPMQQPQPRMEFILPPISEA